MYIVAHELKSPWATMRQLALNLNADNLNRTKHQMVSLSDRELRQVSELTKVARLEDGLFQLEPVAIRSVCDEVTRELRHLYCANHQQLDISYRNKSRLVIANRELLSSVIYNFCINALHYSEANTSAQLSVSDHANSVRVVVRDYGPALPIDIWRSLKAGWLNEPTSIAMRPGSSGLGLFIASKFSRYMNAEISAVRHRDGTSFTLDLPVSRQLSLLG